MTAVDEPPFEVFISYVRGEDDVSSFIDEFTAQLRSRVKGETGREITVFTDRKLEVGDKFWDVLHRNIGQSRAFVACVSGAYLTSDNCREEFLSYQQQARSQDVEGLIIPVLTHGSDFLVRFENDEIANFTTTHQFIDFSHAILQGAGSAEFRTQVSKLAKRIVAEIDRSESAIIQDEESSVPTSASDLNGPSDLDDDDTDLLTEMDSFVKSTSQVGELGKRIGDLIDQIGEVFTAYTEDNTTTFTSADAVLLSRKLEPLTVQLDDAATILLTHMRSADLSLREMYELARFAGPEIAASLHEQIGPSIEDLSPVEGAVTSIEGLLSAMRTPEAMSTAIRRSLRPMRNGLRHTRDAAVLFTTWKELSEQVV